MAAAAADDMVSPADEADTSAEAHFLSILPYGLKPQFDTTHWVPHGSVHHPATAVATARGVSSAHGLTATAHVGSGMAFVDDKAKLAAATAGPARPKGAIAIVSDAEVKSLTAELTTTGDPRKTYVAFPESAENITSLSLLVVHLKNLNKKVSIEVDIQDDSKAVRTLAFSNAQSVVRLVADRAELPMRLVTGWNKLALDLSALCSRVFQTEYRHTRRVRVYAHCRLRRLYFADRVYTDAALPNALRLFPAK